MIRKLTSVFALLALVAMFGAAPRPAAAAIGDVVDTSHVIFHDNYVADYLSEDATCVDAFLGVQDAGGTATDLTDDVMQSEDMDGVYALNDYVPCAWPGDHGWSFLGWSLTEPVWEDDAPTADALNVDYENGGDYDFAAGGTNLWAVWAPPTITYNDPQAAAAGVECTLPDPQFELEGGVADLLPYDCDNSDWSGHQFNGWNDQNRNAYAESGDYDFNNGDLNLSAVWLPIKATVTFKDTTASGCNVPVKQSNSSASWAALRTYTCAWAGHEFLGWSSDELSYSAGELLLVGDTTSFNPESENAYENGQFGQSEQYDFSGYFDGACGGSGCAGFNSTKGLYTGDNTLYAVWQLVSGTVTFEESEGSCELPEPQTGSGVEPLTSYYCENGDRVFYAWNYRLNGHSYVVDNAADFDFAALDGRNITLTAAYHLPVTTLHFVDDTSDCVVPEDVEHAGVGNEDLPAFTCDTDLHFSGWSLTETGEVDYLDEASFHFEGIEDTVNLYAVWDRVTVRFVDNFSSPCGSNDDLIGDWGDTASLPDGCVFAGHDFLGWSSSEEHSSSEGDVDFEGGDTFTFGWSDQTLVTLYAVWSSDVDAPTFSYVRTSSLPQISYSGRLRTVNSTELSAGYNGHFLGDEIEYSYEWYRCNKAVSPTRARSFADTFPGSYGCISVSTDDTYTIGNDDYRKYIVLFVTAYNGGGSVVQMSKSTIRVSR